MSENVRKCPEEENSLREKQALAVDLLALGRGMAEVARSVRIDPRTLYRWRHEEESRAALSARRRELWSDAAARLRGMVHPALDVLDRHLDGNYDRPRLRAAITVLSHSNLRKCADPDADAADDNENCLAGGVD